MQQTLPQKTTRREFLNYVWCASMALVLAQMSGTAFWFALPRSINGAWCGARIAVPVESLSAVGDTPYLNATEKFWLVNTEAGVVALYAICPHLGCRFRWDDNAREFHCPCHGSRFSAAGDYISGPAPHGLDRLNVSVVKNTGEVDSHSVNGEPAALTLSAALIFVSLDTKIRGKPRT